jgi:hypothetical protein
VFQIQVSTAETPELSTPKLNGFLRGYDVALTCACGFFPVAQKVSFLGDWNHRPPCAFAGLSEASRVSCTPRYVSEHQTRSPARILSVSEAAQLADLARPQWKALVLISAWCGLRWGEVSELRRKDIGDDCQRLYVSRAVTRRDGSTVWTPQSLGRAALLSSRHTSATT